MKFYHWIIFALAFWILLVPFLADDLLAVILQTDYVTETELIRLLRWDDLFLGLTIAFIALGLGLHESSARQVAGLRAMHFMQFGLGTWIATAPFALAFDMTAFTWSHFVTGLFVSIFALIQINLEDEAPRKRK
jgi:hypothetical protein